MNTSSVKSRFLVTFAVNILRATLSFLTGMIIARYLGSSDYGDFNFLIASFASISNLVNLASSPAFYTFISQQKRGKKFFSYYSIWIVFQFAIILLIANFLPKILADQVWLGHSHKIVILALLANFAMTRIWQFVGQLGESIRDTFSVQIRNLILAVVYLLFVLFLVKSNLISLQILFMLNAIIYFLVATGYAGRLYFQFPLFDNNKDENFKLVLGEFSKFCAPLILVTMVGFAYDFTSNWFLQKFGGSTQQGYYAIGMRFASISIIATTSIMMVFWKEIAEAYELEDMDKVRHLYRQVCRGLYFLGAVSSCALIPLSKEILLLLVGTDYQSAWLPLSLMLLYSVHQSLGRVTGTMFYALEKTRTQSRIVIITMVVSIVVTYLFLAPRSAVIPGLSLGAVGLSLRMVLCQLFAVNISMFFTAKYIETKFDWKYQIYVLALLLLIGFLSKYCVRLIISLSFASSPSPIVSIAMSGILYLGIVAVLLYRFPILAGMSRQTINRSISQLKNMLRF